MIALFTIVPRWCYALLLIVGLAIGIEIHGQHTGAIRIQKRWDADIAKAEAQAETLRLMRQASIEKTYSKHVKKVAKAQVITRTIIKEVDRYVPNTLPMLPGDFRLLFNAAYAGESLDDSKRANAAPVSPQIVARTTAENAAACRYDQDRLETLQAIIRTLTGIPNGKEESTK